MNKNYISGFFDGEGCVNIKDKNLIITNNNYSILYEIYKSLAKLEIQSHIYQTKSGKTFRLYIFGYHNIKKFECLIGSLMLDKKKKMHILFTSYKNIPLSDKDKIKILSLRKLSYSYRKIANIYNRPPSSIFKICKKFNR